MVRGTRSIHISVNESGWYQDNNLTSSPTIQYPLSHLGVARRSSETRYRSMPLKNRVLSLDSSTGGVSTGPIVRGMKMQKG